MAEKQAKGSGVLAPFESFVMGLAPSIPVAQVRVWLSAFFHPMETYEANKKESNAIAVVVHLALIGLLSWLVAVVAAVLGLNFAGILLLLPGIIAMPLIMVVGGFIGSAILFILAKIFGGKGGYMEQTFALALIFGGATAIAAPFNALAGLPLVGGLMSLVGSLISLYGIYNEYLVIKGIHQLSSMKAAAVVLIPIIIAVIIAVVAAVIIAAILAAAGLGSALSAGY